MSYVNEYDYNQPRTLLEVILVVTREVKAVDGPAQFPMEAEYDRWRYAPAAAYGNNEVTLHPYKSRRMSAAEALAIQSLPKEFELPPDMPLTHIFKTIGNGLPFLAAKHFAGRVHAFLERVSVASSGASSSPPASST